MFLSRRQKYEEIKTQSLLQDKQKELAMLEYEIKQLRETKENLVEDIFNHQQLNDKLKRNIGFFKNYLHDIQHFLLATELKYIDSLNGLEFESFISDLLVKLGYTTRVTPASGDKGVDIIAEKSGYLFAVQCKHYSSSVDIKAVQECFTGTTIYDCDFGIVCTTNYFTAPAMAAAEKTNIELWDRDYLIELLKEAFVKVNVPDSILADDFFYTHDHDPSPLLVTKKNEELDSLYDDAVNLVIREGKANVSLLKKQLKIGYIRADRLLKTMESRGIVAYDDQTKQRKVIIKNNI